MDKNFVNELFDLSGKTAIVTGASRGIGQSMAVALARSGANVALVSRTGSQATENIIKGYEGKCVQINVDLEKIEEARDTIIEQTLSGFGTVDILINNAGVQRRSSVLTFTLEDFDAVMDVNLKVIFALSQAAANIMKKNGNGKIINMASLLSFQGGLNVPAYAASKGAVVQLTKSFSNELASKNINVNAIAPGYVVTDMNKALIEDETRNKSILERIPAGRWAKPEDFMGAAIFLASKASDYLHGHVLLVDGGWMGR